MKKYLIFAIALFSFFVVSPKNVSAALDISTGKTQIVYKYAYGSASNFSELKTSTYHSFDGGSPFYLRADFLVSFSDNSALDESYKATTFYGRYALCMDNSHSAGWSEQYADDVWFYKTSIPCKYYGSSYTGGTITFANFKMLYSSLTYNNGGYQYVGSSIIGTSLYGNTSINFLGFDISNTPFPAYSIDDYIIKQNDSILTYYNSNIEKQNEILDSQNKTNSKLDDIKDMDAPESATTKPDDSDYQNYENAQGSLTDKISDIDTDNVNIAIDPSSSNFIFDTMNKLIKSNPLIFTMFITILSIGIIKLGLGR